METKETQEHRKAQAEIRNQKRIRREIHVIEFCTKSHGFLFAFYEKSQQITTSKMLPENTANLLYYKRRFSLFDDRRMK